MADFLEDHNAVCIVYLRTVSDTECDRKHQQLQRYLPADKFYSYGKYGVCKLQCQGDGPSYHMAVYFDNDNSNYKMASVIGIISFVICALLTLLSYTRMISGDKEEVYQ